MKGRIRGVYLCPGVQPQPVPWRVRQVLPRAQVALGRLNAGLAQAELDLLQRVTAGADPFGEGAPQIVGSHRQPSLPPFPLPPSGL